MSFVRVNVQQGIRIGVHQVQKWLLTPTRNIMDWRADGFSLPGNGQDGDLFFADSIQMLSNGTAKIDVWVRDEFDRPLAGVSVAHGWPSHKYPEADEIVRRTTDDEGHVEWAIFSEFNPMTDIGPLWVTVDDLPADIVLGMGLPMTFLNRELFNYRIEFRRAVRRHG